MSDSILLSEQEKANQSLTPQREKQAQETAVRGNANSIDQATRQALLDKQDIKMNNPVKAEEVELEVELEEETSSEALKQAFQAMGDTSELDIFNTTDLASLIGDSFETMKPSFTLQIVVPLMSVETAETLTVKDEEGIEWSFSNCLAKTGREGKHAGVIYDSLVGILDRMDSLNKSNFLIAGNSLTQNVALDLISTNFLETSDLSFPEVATEEVFQDLVGFVPTLGTSPSQDGTGIIVSFMIPMPIISSGSVSIKKFLQFLKSITSKYSVDTELMFVADPLEFIYDDVQLNNVRELTELGFQPLTLENFVELVEEDFDAQVSDEDEPLGW
jgi:hypothetical protein